MNLGKGSWTGIWTGCVTEEQQDDFPPHIHEMKGFTGVPREGEVPVGIVLFLGPGRRDSRGLGKKRSHDQQQA